MRANTLAEIGRALARPVVTVAVMAVASGAMAAPAMAQVSRVSVTGSNAEANGKSTEVAVSADGRFAAFVSDATNLVPNDTNNAPDLFVKDRQTGAIARVSVRTDGSEAPGEVWQPAISNDGRIVSFLTKKPLAWDDTTIDCVSAFPCGDVYVHDRSTGITTRASVTNAGGQAETWSDHSTLSGNGRFVLFSTLATNLGPLPLNGIYLFVRDLQLSTTEAIPLPGMRMVQPMAHFAVSDDGDVVALSVPSMATDNTGDTVPCDDRTKCERLYVHTRHDGRTIRIEPQIRVGLGLQDLRLQDISADGRIVLFVARRPTDPLGFGLTYTYDRAEGRTSGAKGEAYDATHMALSGDGRTIASCHTFDASNLFAYDRLWDSFETLLEQKGTCASSIAVSHNGELVLWDSPLDTLIAGDTNAAGDIFAYNRDDDGDGIPSVWETRFGLNPQDAADGLLDSDGDGASNLAEYQAGTHPTGTFKRYFAEGAANGFFQYRLDVFAEDNAGVLSATYLGANGRTLTQMQPGVNAQFVSYLSEWGQPTITWEWQPFGQPLPDSTFSVVLESNKPFAAERTMRWGSSFQDLYGSSAERAIVAPATQWYFAEGATGPYSLFYLLENPGSAAAHVTIRYLLPSPQAPIVLTYTVDPHSRRTIDVNQEPGLSRAEVSARITSDLPILAERAMYFSTASQLFAGGHSGAGINAPAMEWFVAEGATGFFRTYLLVVNPGTTPSQLQVSYLLDDGTRIDVPHTVDGESRLTIDIAGEDPRLRASTMSAVIRSLNDVPIVVERVSWWPSGAPIEGSLTAGSTETARRWAVPTAPFSWYAVDSYLLVANPSDEAGTVTVKLRGVDDYSPTICERTFDMPAHSRVTASVRDVCRLNYTKGIIYFSGTVESSGPAVVAERATYWNTATQFWAAGESTALTKLPDVP